MCWVIRRRAPLTQAAATAALYQHAGVKGLEKSAWRLLASEVLKAAAEAEGRHDAASHMLALWLVTLDWVVFCFAFTKASL